MKAPNPRKKAWPREIWPAIPVMMFNPMAPMEAKRAVTVKKSTSWERLMGPSFPPAPR